jgi:SAM-dependent methyltransferase
MLEGLSKLFTKEKPKEIIPPEVVEKETTVGEVLTEQSASEERLLQDPTIVGYLNREDQATTFNTLTSLGINFSNDSILDVGCGLGDMYAFLYEIKLIDNPDYYGIDYNPNMVMLAKTKYQKIQDRFSTVDLLNYDSTNKKDWVIASNVFNINMQTDMNAYLISCIDKMYETCNKGIAFNLIGTYCEAELVAEAVKYDVKEIVDYCIKKYKKVVLRTDYLYDEFTIYCYR